MLFWAWWYVFFSLSLWCRTICLLGRNWGTDHELITQTNTIAWCWLRTPTIGRKRGCHEHCWQVLYTKKIKMEQWWIALEEISHFGVTSLDAWNTEDQIWMVLDKIGLAWLARNTIWFQIDNQYFLTSMFFLKFWWTLFMMLVIYSRVNDDLLSNILVYFFIFILRWNCWLLLQGNTRVLVWGRARRVVGNWNKVNSQLPLTN
jgi:hypothetical protein